MIRRRGLRLAARAAWALPFALGCAREPAPATLAPPPGDRLAYFAFRAGHPELLEPNYLPFMPHRVPRGPEGAVGDPLVFCRWDDSAMPLAVIVEPPVIPAALQDEFDPKPPEAYAAAVTDALATWERELGGVVRFRAVAADEATLRLRLVGETAPEPEPDVAVLGATAIGRACEIGAPMAFDPGDGRPARFDVRFRVSEVRLYVADRYGLLTVNQVRRNALHEIGHALGMRGHSPVPADLMYEVARDRPGADALSSEDVNAFASLYRLPNGTVFGFAGAEPVAAAPPPGPPSGAPRLALAPHVDARFGFALRVPEGWMRAETPQGMFAIDGVTWDYDASLQLIVRAYPSAADYLARHGAAHRGQGFVRERRALDVAGHPALRLGIEGRLPDLSEEVTVIETGTGHVLVVITDCPSALRDVYRPWFEAALGSLRIEDRPGRAGLHP